MKQSALDRLSALKGKDRGTIVRSSALVEWEKTNLFQVHQGREGTALLTEVVLAKCGLSTVDYATPLLEAAITIKSTVVGSEDETTAVLATRAAAAIAF